MPRAHRGHRFPARRHEPGADGSAEPSRHDAENPSRAVRYAGREPSRSRSRVTAREPRGRADRSVIPDTPHRRQRCREVTGRSVVPDTSQPRRHCREGTDRSVVPDTSQRRRHCRVVTAPAGGWGNGARPADPIRDVSTGFRQFRSTTGIAEFQPSGCAATAVGGLAKGIECRYQVGRPTGSPGPASCAVSLRLPLRRAAVAQSVEHVIRNDGVGGSNPFRGTTHQLHSHTLRAIFARGTSDLAHVRCA